MKSMNASVARVCRLLGESERLPASVPPAMEPMPATVAQPLSETSAVIFSVVAQDCCLAIAVVIAGTNVTRLSWATGAGLTGTGVLVTGFDAVGVSTGVDGL